MLRNDKGSTVKDSSDHTDERDGPDLWLLDLSLRYQSNFSPQYIYPKG